MSEQTLYYSVDDHPHRYVFYSEDMHALFGLEEAMLTAKFMAQQHSEALGNEACRKAAWPKKFYLYSSPDPKSGPLYSFSVNRIETVEYRVSNGQRGR